jgi:hypothetical protein
MFFQYSPAFPYGFKLNALVAVVGFAVIVFTF